MEAGIGRTGAAVTNKTHYGRPLTAKVENGQLVIAIGVHVLAHAVIYSDWSHEYEESGDLTTHGEYIRTFAISDAPQFAKDVVSAMLHEREDGSTPLSDFIDKISQAAVEDGSLGLCEEDHRIDHGKTSDCETWAQVQR
jgi:hypothetical protein